MTLVFIAGLLFTALALHPFTTYPASLWAMRKVRPFMRPLYQRAFPQARPLTFSLLTSAHNEEAVAAQMVHNRLSVAALRKAEILVYDDASHDFTPEILSGYEAHIRFIRGTERHGKSFGMNCLADAASGDILVFSDANVELSEDLLERLEDHFRDPKVGCVCGHLIYTNAGDSAMADTGTKYWRLEEQIKMLETATGSAMGADGSLFAIRRSLHRPVPADVIDDMYISFSILADGYRVVRAEDCRAFERSATSNGDEFRRKARIACQAFNVHRMLKNRLAKLSLVDRYKYYSHKWLRWLSPFTGALGLALLAWTFHAWAGHRAFMLAGCAALLTICVLDLVRPAMVRKAWSAAISFCGVGYGVLQSIRGSRYQTWTPTASVR